MTPLNDVDVRERERDCRPKGCCVGVVHRLAFYALCISLRHHGNGALHHVSSLRLRPESFICVLLPPDVPSPSSVSYSLRTSRVLHPCLTPSGRPESFIGVLLPLDVPSPSSVSYSLWTSRVLHRCLTPSINTKSYGERSFFHIAPTLQRSSKVESRFPLYSFL